VADAEDAARAAAKIIDAVAMPYDLAGHEVIITTSAGIALYPENGTDGTELSRLADVAMMEAKQTGRNRYRFFSAELGLSAGRRLELENALRGAVERGELAVNYQPQFCLRTGHLAGIEALARWTHPVLGSVPPADFIPVAETSGLILPIGRWILGESSRQMSVWQQQGDVNFPISVNVSALQFRQADYFLQVQDALHETGLPPASLELELTESLLMTNADTVLDKLRRLDELGVALAIDDFGTGYSSLSYLRQFPAHRLKIDQSFVRDLPESPDAAAIARAIVSLGSTLGMQTIAEGVETAEQVAFLQAIHCDLGQGYSLSYPLSAAAMGALIEQKRAEGALLACPKRAG
jgi:EAL domain-containing protein (putative c-di-GMP-specific phosphodiesterase class I)